MLICTKFSLITIKIDRLFIDVFKRDTFFRSPCNGSVHSKQDVLYLNSFFTICFCLRTLALNVNNHNHSIIILFSPEMVVPLQQKT